MASVQADDSLLTVDRCVKALQEHKLVVLCFQNSQTNSNQEALNGVRDFKADSRYAGRTEVMIIDPKDPKESALIDGLGLRPDLSVATTVIVTYPGRVLATYFGPVEKEHLLWDIKQSSCGCGCPCGCGR